jgi:hypothetical protein
VLEEGLVVSPTLSVPRLVAVVSGWLRPLMPGVLGLVLARGLTKRGGWCRYGQGRGLRDLEGAWGHWVVVTRGRRSPQGEALRGQGGGGSGGGGGGGGGGSC